MLGNPKLVVKAWRKRCYFYASATVFEKVSHDLQSWVEPLDSNAELDEDEQRKRVKGLFKLKKYDKSYEFLGNSIVRFVSMKTNPFPLATSSKKHLLNIPGWKRAMICINLVRFVTKCHANRHWYKFGYKNYKLNQRMFDIYCSVDEEVMSSSTVFQQLPDEHVSTPPPTSKKRTRSSFELSSPEMQKPRRKIYCLISSSDGE